ncbi:hypothetical protein XENOCAPTIV_016142 [Xenoophorus captivus]|uniref:C2H2-type domain-containing protein n=1 Tax=Xenoophorus captivus TaxID=1517983 RepID=A0ABV0QC42_9TELE
MIVNFPAGEQYTYKCLSCPFSSMTISQLKEHSLRDHGEALTLPKLRAATQAAHTAIRLPRQAAFLGSSCHLAAGAVESSLELESCSIPQCTIHCCQLCTTRTNEALRESRADILNVSVLRQTSYLPLMSEI